MSARVRVVTDSTSYLGADLVREEGIEVVPLQVTLGDHTGEEGVDITPADVAAALRARQPVSTSLPSPAAVEQAIRHAARDSHDVCVVHLSSVLSGTHAATSARVASLKDELGVSVRVLDSHQVAMGLGFAVLAAARAATAGASLGEVCAQASACAIDTECYFLVDTLEYLRRGGRLKASQALLGTALSIKPILEVRDGAVVVREKVRTAARALDRLTQLALQSGAKRSEVRIAVHHLAATDAAAVLASRLEAVSGLAEPVLISEVGAVVGAHVGPGLLGVVICGS